MHRLDPLLRPRSVAVLGASRRSGAPGNEALVNLRKGGFGGDIFAVNPACDTIDGVACYASLSDLPQVPQHVIFAISDQRVEAALDEAIALGVEAVTVFSALHLAQDRVPALRDRVRAKALSAGLLLHGANCMGFFNFRDRAWISGFDTRNHGSDGNVALLSQSGAGMSGIADCEERLQFNFAASTGQELCVSLEDYLDFVLDLPETRVVGLFLETARHPHKFIAALQKAQRRQIPIVVIKVGKTELAARMAVSHSGALAGSDAVYQAVFDRYGVQRVDDMAQLATTLIMFAQPHAVAAGSLVTLHDSGGERQLAIDLAEQLEVPLTALSGETVQELESLLEADLPAVNPLDAWAGGADAAQTMAACFSTLLRDPGAALGAVIHDRAPGGEIYAAYLEYLREAQTHSAKPVFLVANHQGSGGDVRCLQATAEGLPVLDGLREFMVGARCLMNYRDFLARDEGAAPPEPDVGLLDRWRERLGSLQNVSELLAGELLADFGISLVPGHPVQGVGQLQTLAVELDYPVVLKTAMPGIAHKSDVGGVVLGLDDPDSLVRAYRQLDASLGPQALVFPEVGGEGVEMILGFVQDAQFGPVVLIGAGGIHAEILRDVVTVLPPFGVAGARRALDRLRTRGLLDKARGRPALAVDEFCQMAARLSVLALALRDHVAEVDINPVKVLVDDCVGLDALVVLPGPALGDPVS